MTKKRDKKIRKLAAKDLERAALDYFKSTPIQWLSARQLIKRLKIANDKNEVEGMLTGLLNRHKLSRDERGRFSWGKTTPTKPRSSSSTREGFVDMTRSGAAYIVSSKEEEDVYVPARQLKGALDGDKVLVEIVRSNRHRTEGKVLSVTQRVTELFMGTLRQSRAFRYVIPNNRAIHFDIIIEPEDPSDADDGDTVLVRVTQWVGHQHRSPVGRIIKKLDPSDSHNIKMDGILIKYGFDILFSMAVMKEAENLPRHISSEMLKGRRDFRQIDTFTIDPRTAKDFDDAISYRTLPNGDREVGIHIADVSHYVKPGTAIDREALRRSTSVYLVDRVAPMLPEVLSNELCSLRPDEDSLTFSVVLTLDSKNTITDKWIGKTVIHSKKRFSYEDAQLHLEENISPFGNILKELDLIAKRFRKQRMKKGSIAFDSQELEFELDENNHPVKVKPKTRISTHLLIEDLMLLANKTVASFIGSKKPEVPFIYRVHDLPDQQKLEEYALLLKELGFQMDISTPKQVAQSFNRLSEAAKTDDGLAFAEPFAVRTMAKAVYATDNIGHFGLAFDNYTHFTSPIRRYADLVVHRILERNLTEDYRATKGDLDKQCHHINNQEKRAAEAERESIRVMQLAYIGDRVGETFDGIVSGFIERGLFVQLKDSGVEGLVAFDTMNEVFYLTESRLKAVSRGGTTIKIGDRVRVMVQAARADDLEVDLKWAD